MIDTQTAVIGLYVAGAATLTQISTYFYERRRERHSEKATGKANKLQESTQDIRNKLEVVGANVDGNLTKALDGIKELKQENSSLKETVAQMNRVIEKLLERNGGHVT